MPNRLALEEQGQFDLGYYHQMQKKYEKREEK
jgi:CRISPR-associated protein Csd1